MSVEFSDYCKAPLNFTNLPKSQRDYWDSLCKVTNVFSNFSDGYWKSLGDEYEKLGEFGIKVFVNMIQGIFSPAGLEMLSIFMGIDLTGKLALNLMYRAIIKGTGVDVGESVAEYAVEKGISSVTGFFLDNVTMNAVVAMAVDEGTMAAQSFAAVEFIADAVDYVLVVFTIIQILGMILDMWDPDGFSQMLDGGMLKDISDDFNAQFETIVLQAASTTTGVFGDEVVLASWPIEYYADNFVLQENGSQTADYWMTQRIKYMFDYMFALQVNSDGYPIFWPSGPQTTLSQQTFDTLAGSVSLILSDGNSVVAGWLYKYWIPLLIIVILLIIFLLVLR